MISSINISTNSKHSHNRPMLHSCKEQEWNLRKCTHFVSKCTYNELKKIHIQYIIYINYIPLPDKSMSCKTSHPLNWKWKRRELILSFWKTWLNFRWDQYSAHADCKILCIIWSWASLYHFTTKRSMTTE